MMCETPTPRLAATLWREPCNAVLLVSSSLCTQVLVKAGTIVHHGVLLLEPSNMTVLGGEVVHMLEEFGYATALHHALGYVL